MQFIKFFLVGGPPPTPLTPIDELVLEVLEEKNEAITGCPEIPDIALQWYSDL